MRALSFLSMIAAALMLFGCAAPFVAERLPIETPATLDENLGFLLVEIDSNSPVHRLRIESVKSVDSHFYIENHDKGRRTILMRVPAGVYRWRRIEMMGYEYRGRKYPYTWEIDTDDQHWRFQVKPGKVNYPGVLILSRQDRWLTYFTLNRSGQMAERLLKASDWLLRDFPVVYTGRLRDDFLEYYSERLAVKSPRPDPVPVLDTDELD